MDSDNTGAWVGFGLVGVIVLGGLVYFFMGGESNRTEPMQQPAEEPSVQREQPVEPGARSKPEQTPPRELPDPVQSYVSLARADYEQPEGRRKYRHEYTRKRLESLGNAIASMKQLYNEKNNLLSEIDEQLKAYGVEIQKDWRDRHSDDVRKAFMETYDAFDYLKRLSGQPQLDLTGLRSEARDIDPDVLYLEQKQQAIEFFREAADRFAAIREGMAN